MKGAKERHIYLLPENHYFARIMCEVIAISLSQNRTPQIIIMPVYGQQFDDSKDSRFPTWMKSIANSWFFYKNQFALLGSVKKILETYLDRGDIKQLKFVSPWMFLRISAVEKVKSLAYRCRRQEIYNVLKEFDITDLVIDTYLRFKPSEKFKQDDVFINKIWRSAKVAQTLVKHYTNKKNKQIVAFASYTSYIANGIFSRQVLYDKCKLVTFGNSLDYYKIHQPLTVEPKPTHMSSYTEYTLAEAKKLPQEVIDRARSTLRNRTNGNYDLSMPYMKKQSLLKHASEQNNDVITDSFVLFLHDFFDGPHAYRWMLFKDFWEWAYETASFCSQNNIHLCIKPHPNQLPESALVVDELKCLLKQSNSIHWLHPNLNNWEIFHKKPRSIITVYGSVAAEAAFCEQRILLAGDHPGINFELGTTAENLENYWQALRNPYLINKGSKEAAIYFTAIHYQNVFLHTNDSLWTHENLNDAEINLKPEILKKSNVNKYVKEMTIKLIKDLSAHN